MMEERKKLDLTNILEKHEFSTIEDYVEYLQTIMHSLIESGEYIIYAHQVAGHRTFSGDTKEEKISGLKKLGLELNHYPTIHGTAYFIGEPQEIDVESDIVNYNFWGEDECTTSFIYALPKYITVNGKEVELASFEGMGCKTDYPPSSPLYKAFQSALAPFFFRVPKDPITKVCLLDAINYSSLPNCFCLGFQSVSKGSNNFTFELNPQHFAFLPEQEQEQILKTLENDAISTCEKFGVDPNSISDPNGLAKLIVESYKHFERYYGADFEFYN